MREQIEATLQVLVGEPLLGAGRAADSESVHFGKRLMVPSSSGTKEIAEYRLGVQCTWRITGPNEIIVASRDMYYPAGDPYDEPPAFEWDQPGANRCDERIAAFFA